jgi:hypothetical protein
VEEVINRLAKKQQNISGWEGMAAGDVKLLSEAIR